MHFQPGRPPCRRPPRAVALAVGDSTRCAKKSETGSKERPVKRFPASDRRDLTKDYREKLTRRFAGNRGFCGIACKTYFTAPPRVGELAEGSFPTLDLSLGTARWMADFGLSAGRRQILGNVGD